MTCPQQEVPGSEIEDQEQDEEAAEAAVDIGACFELEGGGWSFIGAGSEGRVVKALP